MRQVLAVVASFTVGACSSDVLLDGSSEEAFVSSHERLLTSLAPEEKLKLTLAEAVVLSSLPCAVKKEPIPNQPELTKVLGGYTSIKACRREFDGMGYHDILHRSAQVSESAR